MNKKIILVGYMASGKSFIGAKLAKKINSIFIDLDHYIEEKEELSISELFEKKGELYFRKKERLYLEELLKEDKNIVIATGGGTPCYYDNMIAINKPNSTESFYLKVSIKTIINRLKSEKNKRPLVAHIESDEALEEFVGKHLFERNHFYNLAKNTVDADQEDSKVIEDIVLQLI